VKLFSIGASDVPRSRTKYYEAISRAYKVTLFGGPLSATAALGYRRAMPSESQEIPEYAQIGRVGNGSARVTGESK
jgi:hypothetical protein